MARVEQALQQICVDHGHMSGDRAKAYLDELAEARRYQRGVY